MAIDNSKEAVLEQLVRARISLLQMTSGAQPQQQMVDIFIIIAISLAN
jgi:hypothetical protein